MSDKKVSYLWWWTFCFLYKIIAYSIRAPEDKTNSDWFCTTSPFSLSLVHNFWHYHPLSTLPWKLCEFFSEKIKEYKPNTNRIQASIHISIAVNPSAWTSKYLLTTSCQIKYLLLTFLKLVMTILMMLMSTRWTVDNDDDNDDRQKTITMTVTLTM